jgi:hypothetical protein
MNELDGILITEIDSIGTSEFDEQAFVQCRLHDGSLCAIGFASPIASPLCSAFLAAAAKLSDREMRKPVRATPIAAVRATNILLAAARLDGASPSIVLSITTLGGPKLFFEVPLAVGKALALRLATVSEEGFALPLRQQH